MINPRFLAGNTWKHILGCFNPILVIVYGIASQFLISSIHFVRLRNRLFCGHWYPFGCLQTPCLGIEKRTCLILESWTPKRTKIVHIFWIGYLHYSPTTKIHKKPCSQGSRVICVGRKLKSKLIFKVEWEIGTFDSCNGLAQGPKGKSQETLLLPVKYRSFLQFMCSINPLTIGKLHR